MGLGESWLLLFSSCAQSGTQAGRKGMTVTHTQAHTHKKKREYIYNCLFDKQYSVLQRPRAFILSFCPFTFSLPFFLFSSPVSMPLRKRQCPLSGKEMGKKKDVVDCSVVVLPLNDLS